MSVPWNYLPLNYFNYVDILWDVTPYSLVRYEGIVCLHHQGIWRQNVPLERRHISTKLHGVTFQKKIFSTTTSARASDLTNERFICGNFIRRWELSKFSDKILHGLVANFLFNNWYKTIDFVQWLAKLIMLIIGIRNFCLSCYYF